MLSVTDENVATVTGADRGVLILAEESCAACRSYTEDIRGLEEDGCLGDVVIGKIVLDRPGSGQFKRGNPWLRSLEHLPHTIVFKAGVKVDEFAASRGRYLVERLGLGRGPVRGGDPGVAGDPAVGRPGPV